MTIDANMDARLAALIERLAKKTPIDLDEREIQMEIDAVRRREAMAAQGSSGTQGEARS